MKFLALILLAALLLNNQFREAYRDAMLLHATIQLALALLFSGALVSLLRAELDSLLSR